MLRIQAKQAPLGNLRNNGIKEMDGGASSASIAVARGLSRGV
jgi:hypothetical protein